MRGGDDCLMGELLRHKKEYKENTTCFVYWTRMHKQRPTTTTASAASAPLYDPRSFGGNVRAEGKRGDDSDATSENSEVPEPTPEELETFKVHVSEWSKLDEQIKKLSVAIRERRVHQRALSSQIQEFMGKFKYDDLQTRSGRIRHNVRTVPVPLKLSEVRAKILELGGDAAEEIVTKIFEDPERPKVEKRSLRRIVPKVSMHLDI